MVRKQMARFHTHRIHGDEPIVLRPIGPTTHWSYTTAHWSYNPLVLQPIGPTAHWCYNPLVLHPIGATAHWSYNPLVLQPIGPTTHWSYSPLVLQPIGATARAQLTYRQIGHVPWAPRLGGGPRFQVMFKKMWWILNRVGSFSHPSHA